jgi:hypothetical protein
VSTNVPLTAVEKFSASLNNLILNRLASETMGTLFGTTSTLSKGEYIAGDFKVVVTEEPLNILKIVTTDKAGNSSEILISKGTL